MTIHPLETPEAWDREPFNPHEVEGPCGSIPSEIWALPDSDPEGKSSEASIAEVLSHLATRSY